MSDDILPINFRFSNEAKRGISILRDIWIANVNDPPGVLSVAWAQYVPDSGRPFEQLMLGFYGESELPEIAWAQQYVDGIPLIYFVTERDHGKFDGKVVDYTDEGGFFLRDPN